MFIERHASRVTRLRAVDEQRVRTFHILFASIWIGATLCRALIALTCSLISGHELYAIHLFLVRLDQLLIVPAAVSLLFTAVVIARLTDWQQSRHRHGGRSWAMLLSLLALDVVCLGPWTIYLFKLVDAQGAAVLQDPTYLYFRTLLIIFSAIQCAGLLATMLLVRFKPREQRRLAVQRTYWKLAQPALKS
jgi:hypothetical protein